MKKILFFSLFFIIVISVCFWVGSARAAETNCGNLSYTNGYYMGSFSAGQSKSFYCPKSPEGGRAYYFYLPSTQAVTITLTHGTGAYPKFALYSYKGGSGEDWLGVGNALYFSETNVTDTLSSGYYTITVFGGIAYTNFTLTVSTNGGFTPRENGASCGWDFHCKSNNCDKSICCPAGVICCKSDSGCPAGSFCKATDSGCYYKRNDGVSCSRVGQCKGGYCVQAKCSSEPAPYCGDGNCQGSENCSNCAADCSCYSSECCSLGSSNTDSRGCVDSGDTMSGGKVCCSGKAHSGNCCTNGDCNSGYECSDYQCEKMVVCGDGSCDSGENCSDCKKDCVCAAGGCCLGFLKSGDLIPKGRDTKGCVSDHDAGAYQKGSGYRYRYICCDGKEENAGPALVESWGKGPDCCSDADCPGGKCITNFCWNKEEISEQTQNLINEYAELVGEISQLNNEIDVEEVSKLEVSPDDMHTAIQVLAESLIEEKEIDKAEALLKNVIAAEKLALATYNGEAEMAQMLAESSWQSFKAYLFHKLEPMISAQIDRLFGELTEEEKKLAEKIKTDYEEVEKPEEVLERLGFKDTAEVVGAINQAYDQAQGNVNKYLENIENQVRQHYIDAYVEMFNENFKYAISNQLVYYQVSAWHYTEYIDKIPNADIPYNEYQAAIQAIQKEIEEEKQYIRGDNIFVKITELNEKIKEGTVATDKILSQLGGMATAVDKGASLAGKETNFGDAIESLGKLNENLKDVTNLATEVLEIPGKFAESLYGTYKEAKLYSIFFNTYDRWYEECLGGSQVLVRVPLTGLKVDITSVYNLSRSLLGTADQVLVAAAETVNYLADGAKAIADTGVEMIKEVGETIDATIEQGKKMTQNFISAGKSFVYGIRWPRPLGCLPQRKGLAQIPAICAQGENQGIAAELVLISPSGLEFPGQPYDDGLGMYVVINDPEVGEWTAEIIGKEVEGKQPIEIITSVEAKDLGELKSEGTERPAFLKLIGFIIILIAVVILAGVLIWYLKLRKK